MRSFMQCLVMGLAVVTAVDSGSRAADRRVRLSDSVENELVKAKILGNLESFNKGLRGASAILQARAEGLDLKDRLRVIWLGGSNNSIVREFNGNNDPWSMFVVAHSGVETWIVPAPVGARVAIDKRTEGHLYADHPLGRYLKQIVPAKHKALFDASALSSIISLRLDLDWIKEVERIRVAGPDQGYAWTRSDAPQAVRVIREIDEQAMQSDLFDTMKGKPTPLIGIADP